MLNLRNRGQLNIKHRLAPNTTALTAPFLDALAAMIAADVVRELRRPRLLNLKHRPPTLLKRKT